MKTILLLVFTCIFLASAPLQVRADTKTSTNPTTSDPQSKKIVAPTAGPQVRGISAAQNSSMQLNEVTMLKREVELLKRELTTLRREIHQHRHEIRNAQAVTVHELESNKVQYRQHYLMLLQPGGGNGGTPRTAPPIESFSR